MAGIYFHIPFCKQACHYCNFHFATSLRYKNEMQAALLSELEQRKEYLKNETIETIYFGGGTPSLIESASFKIIVDRIHALFNVDKNAELTIEINPDDVTEEKVREWKVIGFNRLSLGVQSFFDDDLKWMNRIHTAREGLKSLELAQSYFKNISIDLIYGTPKLTAAKWRKNLETALKHEVPHLSCYALTVEPKTPLHKMIRKNESPDISSDEQAKQFLLLMRWCGEVGYEHYEISNFAKPGFRSRHNSSYWSGKKYLGIGPSAHSFDGVSRQWNVSNNNIYIESINQNKIPFEKEILTKTQKLNEYIMTSLRTLEGLNLERIPEELRKGIHDASKRYLDRGLIIEEQQHLILSSEGKLIADGIAAALFLEPETIIGE
jgi:putative oxygen-independent coproporphyrinogen III oxidase